MEKADLDQALEALDSQHQDEMSQLLMIRDELSRKLKASQDELRRSTVSQTCFCFESSANNSSLYTAWVISWLRFVSPLAQPGQSGATE